MLKIFQKILHPAGIFQVFQPGEAEIFQEVSRKSPCSWDGPVPGVEFKKGVRADEQLEFLILRTVELFKQVKGVRGIAAPPVFDI